MKTNVLNVIRLLVLLLPLIGVIMLIASGIANVLTEEPVEEQSWMIVNKPIGPTQLKSLNPVEDNIEELVEISNEVSLEPEESNELKEESKLESTFIEEVEESITEGSIESEEPKHTMSVESSKPNDTYSDIEIEYEPHPDFVYYPKYYDVTYKSDCGIALSREHQSFAYSKCKEYGVPFEVMMGLWGAEASWNVYIGETVSAAGDHYYGIGQINVYYSEEYLKQCGVELCTPLGGLEGSIIIIRDKLERYGGDINKALMAYNFGDWGAQKQWNKGVYSTYYTKKILSIANNLKEGN